MGFRIGQTVKMTGVKAARKKRDPIMMVCLAIFVIAVAIVVVAYINDEYVATSDVKASTGDTVTVDYTGTYYDEYGNEGAVVFDTSYSKIANDDDIAKSNDFTKRSSYSALEFKIGAGTMLADFENAVIGLKEGQTTKIKIDAAHGYAGSTIEGTLNTTGNTMSSSVKMTYDEFNAAYPDVSIKGTTGMVAFESKFKWDAYAQLADNGKSVMVTYMPKAGETYTVYESGETTVKYNVTSFTDGTITYDIDIQNPVYVDNGGNIQMIKLDLGAQTIYITKILAGEITYKEGEGAERINQPLYFEIKLVSVE